MQNLTAIIPYFNGDLDTLAKLVNKVSEYLPIVIVDDHSDFILSDMAGDLFQDNVSIIRPEKKGYFTGAVNAGIEAVQNIDVLVLNQDLEIVGDQWIDYINTKQDKGFAVAGDGVQGHPAWPTGYVQGTFMYMSRKAIDEVGLLNAELYSLWGSTCEWQARACRNGFIASPDKLDWVLHRKDKNQKYGSAITTVLKREPQRKSEFISTPPLISVIIPCYNYGRYLHDAVNSLIGGNTSLGTVSGQTLQSFEIVIVDDASTDDSWNICQELRNEWMGIRVIRNQKNLGTAESINVGVQNSYGKYFTVLSADDMRKPDSLEKLYQAIKGNDGKVFAYDSIHVYGEGRLKKVISMGDFNPVKILTKNNIHAGILCPRKAFNDVGGYPSAMRDGREDWAFNVSLVSNGYRGIYVQSPGYLYRREGQNRTADDKPDKKPREYFLEKIRKIFPDLYKQKGADMPCPNCGGPRGSKSVVSRASSINFAGKDGFTLLEYIGRSHGTQPWYGPATKTCYMFGLSKPVRFVDNRDVPGMLELIEARKPVFQLYQKEEVSQEKSEDESTQSDSVDASKAEVDTGEAEEEKSQEVSEEEKTQSDSVETLEEESEESEVEVAESFVLSLLGITDIGEEAEKKANDQLRSIGIATVDDLRSASDEDLLAAGIGKRLLKKIKVQLDGSDV